MFKNYLILALRTLRKNKISSLVNIFGLGTGIACCILTYYFIHNELSFDRFHPNLDKIFEVKTVLELDIGRVSATTPPLLGPFLKEQFPEVVDYVRMTKERMVIRKGEKIFEEQGLVADPNFFQMFNFTLKYGRSEQVLKSLDSIVLSERAAQKYFGTVSPINRILAVRIGEEFQDFVVTGVAAKIPDNSSLRFDFIVNQGKIHDASQEDWNTGLNVSCFLQLQNKEQAKVLEQKFQETADMPLRDKYGEKSSFRLFALSSYHLGAGWSSYILEGKSHSYYSLILAGISLLVLLIGCFNFINLTIGSSSSRLKEIGMRKVLGAQKRQLIRQFWLESTLMSFISLFVGLVLAECFMPAFNQLSQKNLQMEYFSAGSAFPLLLGLIVFIGIASGSYPALVLSKFSSIDLFQGKFKLSRKNKFSRLLIVFQFSISIFLMVTTVFLYQQHNFMRQRDLGYNQNQVVIVPLSNIPGESTNNSALFASLRDRLLSYDSIQGVSGSQYGLSSYWMATYFKPKEGENKIAVYNYVDHDFIQTLEMSLLEGRNFSREFLADIHKSILVNEAFVKLLGEVSPVGHNLSEYFTGDFDRQIIGVVKDFHYQSLYDPILPGFMGLVADGKNDNTKYDYAYIKFSGVKLGETLANIKKEFQEITPHTPFTYSFLDETLARQYIREKRWSRLVKYASIFAIIIACSGLFGLTLLSIARRTKEIGIRKVLGASVAQIIQLVNREFIWLVLAGNLIAWPAAYGAVSLVFRNYAFRVPLTVWIFLLAGGLALVMAVTTMSIHSLRAARSNPAETLKYE